VYALGTETWSISSQAMWQHGFGELAIIACLACLERWAAFRTAHRWLWACGVCAAAAFLFRPTNAVLLPALLIALLVSKARFTEYLRLFAGPAAGAVLLESYNFYVFTRSSGGYPLTGFRGSMAKALVGMFLSPGRGLLFFTPVAIFALCAFMPRAADARRKCKALVAASAAFIVLDALVVSRWAAWWGGFCWGPRLLTEMAPPVIVLIGIGTSVLDRVWPRRAFAVLALFSVFAQGLGSLFYPNGHWDYTPVPVNKADTRLWDWQDNPITRTVRGGIFWEPYAIVGAAVTGGLPAARQRMSELNFAAYEQAAPGEIHRKNPGLP
jgi:hypothetical protein